jgi:hypothetical protein
VDPEIKAKWVEALRSGRYQQATGKLMTEEGYCCLGVLCEVAGLPIALDGFNVVGADLGEDDNGYRPINELVGGRDLVALLYEMNDDERKTFPEIADYIEANL